MKIIWLLFSLSVFAYAVHGKPTSEDDYEGDYGQMLKDTEDEEYDNPEEESEESPNDTPPTIVTKSQDFLAKAGGTLFLPCEVLNGENHVIMWKKNQTMLFQDMIQFGGEKNKYERMKNATLIIKNADSSDSGEYVCNIPLVNQDKIQIVHHVAVETSPKIVSLSSPNNLKELKVGDSLILTCDATGIPKPKINWYFKNELLVRHSDETLQIDNIGHHNAGQYRCLADNGVGTAAHSSISVSFMHKPVITIQEVSSNETIKELRCEVEAVPPVSHLKWKFNGTVIETDHNMASRLKNNVLRLTFEDFSVANFGRYTCIARNNLGRSEQTVAVDLLPKKPKLESNVPSHKYVELTWTVQSSPLLTDNVIDYKREQDDVWKTEKPTMVVALGNGFYTVAHNFTELRHGKYVAKLISSNEYGSSEPSDEEKFIIKGHTKHHHNEKKRVSFEDATLTAGGESQAAPSNDPVLNDQEDTTQTGSQISGVTNVLPRLSMLLPCVFAMLQ